MEVQRGQNSEWGNTSSFMFVPEQEWRYQHSFLSAMCCVDWVYHEYHTPSLHPSPKKNPSQWAVVNSASFPTEVKLVAMISVSPLAILAPERDTFALLGQLRILYGPPPSASDHTSIWSEGQQSQGKFSRPVLKCQRERERVVWGRAVSDLLSTHSMLTDLRAWASNKAENHHLFMQVSDQGALWLF